MKKIILLVFVVSLSQVFGQHKSLNQYQYVIVDSKFDFVKDTDKYKTSSLTKFLFNKYGFKAYLDNEQLPNELSVDRCKVLRGSIIDGSKMLKTVSTVQLKDCNGKVVYTSRPGESRKKDYTRAYYESINEAFTSFNSLNYKYSGKDSGMKVVKPKIEKRTVEDKPMKKMNRTLPVLKASLADNGLILKNNKKQEVFTLLKSRFQDVYLIKDKNGTLTKNKEGIWVAEYYDKEGKPVTEEYKIEF